MSKNTPPRVKDPRTGLYQEPRANNLYLADFKQKATIQDILQPPAQLNIMKNHPLDKNPTQNNFYNEGGNRLAPFAPNFEPFPVDHAYNSRRNTTEPGKNPENRSVSRFDLNQNRAHNPHENPFNAATYSRYESSPQRQNFMKKGKMTFLEKIKLGEFQGVLQNKNESRGFDRYVGDCKEHMDMALNLQKMQKSWKLQPPIPIIIPPNPKSILFENQKEKYIKQKIIIIFQ